MTHRTHSELGIGRDSFLQLRLLRTFPGLQLLAYLRNWQESAVAQGTQNPILKGERSLLTPSPSQVSTRHWGLAEKAQAAGGGHLPHLDTDDPCPTPVQQA